MFVAMLSSVSIIDSIPGINSSLSGDKMAPKTARIAITTISVRVNGSILFVEVGIVH